MVLKLSSAGILSLLFTPVFVLIAVRFMGNSSDPLDVLWHLMVAESFSFVFSVILIAVLKFKARTPAV